MAVCNGKYFALLAALSACALTACSGATPTTIPSLRTPSADGASVDRTLGGTRGGPQPTATPSPTPVPTPTASPTPSPDTRGLDEYLSVAVQTPTLIAQQGTNTFACALQITTADPSALAYADLAGFAANTTDTFPAYRAPAKSAVSWSVPDLSGAKTTLYNGGERGQTVWTSPVAHEVQTHCVDLIVDVPPAVRAGSYPLELTYQVGIGARTGVRGRAASQTVSLNVVVEGAP
ncbi:MAG TPA: hypothetical protein VMD91_06580 [Candidatus Sulfotelmatobacter sp.]|nr:hypothetical protein [Candidatus Sulfotelmatobacter sp.]